MYPVSGAKTHNDNCRSIFKYKSLDHVACTSSLRKSLDTLVLCKGFFLGETNGISQSAKSSMMDSGKSKSPESDRETVFEC